MKGGRKIAGTSRSLRTAILLLTAALATGCAADAQVADGGDVHPTPLQIDLEVATEDGRRMAYRLDREGMLHFAGGRQVLRGDWRESGELSLEQRGRLWNIVQEHALMEASGELFAQPERVRYQVDLRAGRDRNGFTAVDDRVAGLAELAEALQQLHREYADDELYRSIEGAIRKSGGNVPRR